MVEWYHGPLDQKLSTQMTLPPHILRMESIRFVTMILAKR